MFKTISWGYCTVSYLDLIQTVTWCNFPDNKVGFRKEDELKLTQLSLWSCGRQRGSRCRDQSLLHVVPLLLSGSWSRSPTQSPANSPHIDEGTSQTRNCKDSIDRIKLTGVYINLSDTNSVTINKGMKSENIIVFSLVRGAS